MEDFNKRWLFKPEEIDCLILSHAHIDHAGRIPKLFKDGFRGIVHCTHATRSLCSIMLMDSAMIQVYDAEKENKRRQKEGEKAGVEPLYKPEDVKLVMDHFTTYPYNQWIRLSDEVEFMFKDAGHILGSANVNLRIKENGKMITLAFSGDRKVMSPRPKAWYLFRMLMMRFIHHSREEELFCCISTLTVAGWYSGSLMRGRYRECGWALEKPALRSRFHCMGVRTPSRSPRCTLSPMPISSP